MRTCFPTEFSFMKGMHGYNRYAIAYPLGIILVLKPPGIFFRYLQFKATFVQNELGASFGRGVLSFT